MGIPTTKNGGRKSRPATAAEQQQYNEFVAPIKQRQKNAMHGGKIMDHTAYQNAARELYLYMSRNNLVHNKSGLRVVL